MQKPQLGIAVVVLALLACKKPGDVSKEPPQQAGAATAAAAPPAAVTTAQTAPAAPAAPGAATPAAAATPSAAPAAAAFDGKYPMNGIASIAENCAKSTVVVTAVTTAALDTDDFHWNFAQQVWLANPQFKAISPLPASGDFIAFDVMDHIPTKGAALVAHCNRAETCMQFAAAYKTVVPTSHPAVECGATPTLGAFNRAATFGHLNRTDDLPEKKNVIGQCVRLAACTAHRDGKLDGDPAIECQKKPSTFPLHCALKSSCDGVLSCVAEAAADPTKRF